MLNLPGQAEESDELSFTFQDLVVATNNYRADNVILENYSGLMYRGILPVFPFLITVKVFDHERRGVSERFEAELRASRLCRHPNILQILGSNSERSSFKLLIFEGIPGGTLKDLLHADPARNFGWDARLNIALDVANGLSHLHEGCDSNIQILHRNVNPGSIFLWNLTAKIGRLDLAIIVEDGDEVFTDGVAATTGYFAPEHAKDGVCSSKGDVYGFGVTILEMITRKRAYDNRLPYPHTVSDIIDLLVIPDLEPSGSKESVTQFVDVARCCTLQNPEDRPNMREVVVMLETIISARNIEQKSPSPAHEQPCGYSSELRKRAEHARGQHIGLKNIQIQIRLDRPDHQSFIRKYFKRIFARLRRNRTTD